MSRRRVTLTLEIAFLVVLLVVLPIASPVIFPQNNSSPTPTIPASIATIKPERLPEARFIASPVNPLDGLTLYADRNIALSWSPVSGASAYKVELWGEPYNLMVPCNWKEATTCQIGQMWKGHTYSWHVKSRNGDGQETDWSPTWSFTVSSSGPPLDAPGCLGAPRLQSPEDGVVTSQGAEVTFGWLPPVDCEPNGYTLHINTSDDPEEKPWIVDTGKDSSPHAYTFTAPGTYFWHVRPCKPCTPYDPGAWALGWKVVVK